MAENENDISGKVSLDLTNFKANISALSQQIRVIETGFKASAAGMADWGSNAEGLQSRIQAMTGIIELQRQKVDNLKGMYAKIAAEKGETSKAAQDLQIRINNETAALNKHQLELKATTERLDKMGKESDKTGADVKQLGDKLDNTGREVKQVGNELDDAGKKAVSFSDILKANVIGDFVVSGLKAIGSAIKSAFGALKDFVSEGLGLASDLTEVQNVVDTTFEKNSGVVDDFAKSAATSFGLSELAAKQYSGTMGAMLKSMGLGSDTVTDMSTSLVGLAGDMASFYNLDSKEAFDKLRAGIAGETEPLKQLGINMSVVNLEAYALSQGIETAFKDMNQAEQATLRYNYIMQTTADAQGDFAKTSDSLANQQRILELNMDNAAASIGGKFLPGVTDMTKAVNGLLSGSIDADEFATQLLDALDGMLAQINEMLPAYLEQGKAIVSALASGIVKTLPTILSAASNILTSFIGGIIETLPTLVPAAADIIMQLVKSLIYMLPQIVQAGIDIFIQLALGLAQALPELIPAIVDAVILIVETLINNIDLLVDAAIQLMAGLTKGLIKAIPQLVERIPEIIVAILNAFAENFPLLVKVGWEMIFALAEALVKAIPELLKSIPKIMEALFNAFNGYMKGVREAGKAIVTGLWEGISSMIKWIKDKISGFVDGIVGGIKEFFGIHSPSTVMAGIGGNLSAGLAEGITGKAGLVKSAMAALASQINGSQTLSATVTDAGSGTSGGGFGLATTNLYLDSNQILSATSPVQYSRNNSKARALGVVLA